MNQAPDPNQTVDEAPRQDSITDGLPVPSPDDAAAPARLVLLEEIARGGCGAEVANAEAKAKAVEERKRRRVTYALVALMLFTAACAARARFGISTIIAPAWRNMSGGLRTHCET